jgi:hypothetical protein
MERRTIPELATLYELEPSVRDIYVEGPTDRAFFFGVLQRVGYRDVQVREIDCVNVTDEQLQALNLSAGSRQRVIALAVFLERFTAKDLTSQVICIADADDEAGMAPYVTASILIYTDVTSLTIYAFTPQCLQWYLDVVSLGFPMSGQQVINSLLPILRQVAIVRRALKSLRIDCSLVDLTRDCSWTDGAVEFDGVRFFDRLVNKANAHARRAELDEEIALHSELLAPQPHLWVHAEDFVALFYWMIVRVRGPVNVVARHLLGRTLLLGLQIEDVVQWGLLENIRDRFSLAAPARP